MPINYKASPTIKRFHEGYKDYIYRFIAGSPGSGKSVGCVWELIATGLRQEPTPEGIRPTKFLLIRATYAQLERTTLDTLLTWLPKEYTEVTYSKPMKVLCKMPLPDGTIAEMRFELLAISNVRDLVKLDSYEVTGAWLNEVVGLPAEAVGKAGERCGRYPPSMLWGDGKSHCTWRGVIADYNYPNIDHWIVKYLHSGGLPPNTMLYQQPPALLEHIDKDGKVTYSINPEAENLVNLDNGKKYLNDLETYQLLGAHDMIETRLLCRYSKVGSDGKPVFNNFDRDKHVGDVEPKRMTNTLVSIDTSGIHPCGLFWQMIDKKWCVTDGLYGENMGFEEFIDSLLIPLIDDRYAGCKVECVCDPANARDSRTAVTPTGLLHERGFRAFPAPSNILKERLQASEMLLSRTGDFSVVIDTKVDMLIKALSGGYQYKKLVNTGLTQQYHGVPLKNEYSHWADAFQYGALHIITNTISEEDLAKYRRIALSSYQRGQ